MIQLRKSEQRGHANHGWLDAHHSFSFANYYDPKNMGFGVLRVINEDRISAGAGFPTHSHKDMEIVTYIVSGALEHKDSMGNAAVILPGEVQRMSAGTGVRHSEFNSLKDQPTHLLQIWMLPNAENHPPGYEQKSFSDSLKSKALNLVLSQQGREGSLKHNQDVDLYASNFQQPFDKTFILKPGRHLWIQMIDGELSLSQGKDQAALKSGDAANSTSAGEISLLVKEKAHFLLFDLPAME
jgi:redox-sensitive bicupin YhaK (pirin superfamily)